MCIDFFFFFQAEDGIRDVAVTGVQTCALPISVPPRPEKPPHVEEFQISGEPAPAAAENTPAAAPPIPLDKPAAKTTAGKSKEKPAQKDRKSTRLNSSHGYISYAVFCLKKKRDIQRPVHAAHVY